MALLAPKDHGGLFPLTGPELAALLGLVPAGGPGEPGPAAAFDPVLVYGGRVPVARKGGLFAEERPAWSYPCYPANRSTDGGQAGRLEPVPEPEKWAVRVTEYPDGGGEASVCQLAPPRVALAPVRSWEQAPARPGPRPRSAADRIRDNRGKDRRAASKVRRLVRQRELTMMLTFTWPGPGQFNREKAMQQVALFLKRAPEAAQGGGWLLVPELHPDGHGWHVHLFTGVKWYEPRDLASIREGWTGFLVRRGWTLPPGTQWVRVNARRWWSAKKAGFYASKYAAKALEAQVRAARAWRYSVSLGLLLLSSSLRVAAWWHVLRSCGRSRVPVVYWRSWVEGEAPEAWPVAWFAWENPGPRGL